MAGSIQLEALHGLKGINLLKDPAALTEGEYAWAKNCWPNMPGLLGRRPALQWARSITAQTYSTAPKYPAAVLGDRAYIQNVLGPAQTAAGLSYQQTVPVPVDFEFGRSGNDMVVILVDDNAIYWAAAVPTLYGRPNQLVKLGQLDRTPTLFSWNQKTYILAAGVGMWVVQPDASTGGDGFSIQPFGFNNQPGFAQYCAVDAAQRFWWANFGAGNEDMIWFSEPFQPGILTDGNGAGADHFNRVNGYNLTTGDGGAVTAIAQLSTSQAGAPNASSIFLWTRSSTFQIQGEPLTNAEATDPNANPYGTLQVVRLNTVAGCVSQRGVVQTPYGAFWIGEDDVWFMPFGSLPIRVGTKIRPALLAAPPSNQWRHYAVYDKGSGSLRICVMRPGDSSGYTTPPGYQYWLDLRNGPPEDADSAVWWGPMEFNPGGWNDPANFTFAGAPHSMKVDSRITGDGKVYAIAPYDSMPTFVVGWDTSERIGGIALCTVDSQAAFDSALPVATETAYPWVANVLHHYGDVIAPFPDHPSILYWNIAQISGLSGASNPFTYPNPPTQVNDNAVVWSQVGTGDALGNASAAFATRKQHSVRYNPGANGVDTVIGSPTGPGNWTTIQQELRSRETFFGGAAYDDLIDGIELSYYVPAPSQVKLQTQPFIVQQTLDIPGDYNDKWQFGLGPRGDSSSYGLGQKPLGRSFSNKLLTPGQRVVKTSMQFILQTLSGLYTPASTALPQTITVPIWDSAGIGGNVNTLTINLASFLWANGLYDLVTALNAQFATNLLDDNCILSIQRVAAGGVYTPFQSPPFFIYNYDNGTGNTFWIPMTLPALQAIADASGIYEPRLARLLDMLGFTDDYQGCLTVFPFGAGSDPGWKRATRDPYANDHAELQVVAANVRYRAFGRRPT